jgi:hypothetical protein
MWQIDASARSSRGGRGSLVCDAAICRIAIWVSIAYCFRHSEIRRLLKATLNKSTIVIPAHAGIQLNRLLDPGFCRGDDLFKACLTCPARGRSYCFDFQREEK